MWNSPVCCAFFAIFLHLLDGADSHRVKRIVGGTQAAQPPPDDPVVFTKLYARDARIEGFRNQQSGLYTFVGIPFAHPPIGSDRFRKPRYKRLEGDINATVHGLPCPQPNANGDIVGAENCLWLNIYTPQMPDETTGLPVIVFIHGGGYRIGSANQYTANAITSKRVIFVPIQYRLGSLGILGDGTPEFSGNAALFDMAAALRWVNEYISFFGGDPKQVHVMGHGSGATAATSLTTTQRSSREHVSGVIAMSGTPFTQDAINVQPKQAVAQTAEVNACPATNETELVNCLRAKNFKDIILNDAKIQGLRLDGKNVVRSMSGNVGYEPSIEHPSEQRSLPGFLEEDPRDVLRNGTFKKIPLLVGVTRDETANGIDVKAIQHIFATVTKFLESVAGTLKVAGAVGNVVNTILPGLDKTLPLTDYLKVSEKLNVMQTVQKLTEATTDALFNLPAMVTSQTWSKVAPAYLYSFEYVGRSSAKGSSFLQGLPIVSNPNPSNQTVAHGDELSYLFDAHDIYGSPLKIDKPMDESDKKVRDIFSNLITKFVYSSTSKAQSANKGLFEEFSADRSNFLRIREEIVFDKDFRFCQLAIWGAEVKPSSKDTSCKFIGNQLASALLSTTGGLTGSIGSQLSGTLGKLKTGEPGAQKGIVVDESMKAHGKPLDKQSASAKHGGVLGILGLF